MPVDKLLIIARNRARRADSKYHYVFKFTLKLKELQAKRIRANFPCFQVVKMNTDKQMIII